MLDTQAEIIKIHKFITKIANDADELIMSIDNQEDYEEIKNHFTDPKTGLLFQAFRLIKQIPLEERPPLMNRLLSTSNKIQELFFVVSAYVS